MGKPSPFTLALRAAEKDLEKKTLERMDAQATIGRLNIEIPALERTVASLKHQLDPTAPAPGSIAAISSPRIEVTGDADAILAKARAAMNVDYDSMGSNLVPTTESNGNEEIDIDKIPGIGGGGFV